jgi:hypothetical protein
MAYRLLDASLSMNHDPKSVYTEQFQTILAQDFKNSFDWYTIQEELVFASGELSDIDVRINHAIDARTNQKLGDDYKLILFSDTTKATGLGYLYYFDSNYWITINTESIKNLATSITVKRCNNTLRWVDNGGAKHSSPCSISYVIKENRDYGGGGSTVVTPFGVIDVIAQLNTETNLIRPNQRFLFGNTSSWHGYKVFGGGVNSYNNLQTEDNTSAGLLTLTMQVDYVNDDVDDLTNGIALDMDKTLYTLSLYPATISGGVAQTVQLVASTFLNGVQVTRDVTWSTSDGTKATVSTSGLVTFVAIGSCTITATLEDNVSISDTCSVTVGGSPVNTYQILITPDENFILEGDSKTFVVKLYKNGVDQSAAFVFSVDTGNVPLENYLYDTISTSSFTVTNLERFLTDTLDITCTSGAYSKVLQINLRGSW